MRPWKVCLVEEDPGACAPVCLYDVQVGPGEVVDRGICDPEPQLLILEVVPKVVFLHVSADRRLRFERDVSDVVHPFIVDEAQEISERQ